MKRFKNVVLIAFLLYLQGWSFSKASIEFPKGSLEEALFEDAADGEFNRLGLEQAALIASGVTQKDLLKYITKIDSLYNHIALRWPMKKLNAFQKGHVILVFLHRTALKTYDPGATEIQKALDDGRFNCVSATLLFNILCERFGVKTAGIEVPTHLYSVVYDKMSPFVSREVQTTIPLGFLIQQVPWNEFIYNSKIQTWKGKRVVSRVPLIAVIYYNRGIYWIRQKAYDKALPYYQRAFLLDPGFPALGELMVQLYAAWGYNFFNQGQYAKAVQIYREGLRLLQGKVTEKDATLLKEHLTAAFINSANLLMRDKKWENARLLLSEAGQLGFHNQTVVQNEKALYYAWGQDFIDQKKWYDALNIYQLARKNFPGEKGFLQNLKWTYARIGEDMIRRRDYKRAKAWFQKAHQDTAEPKFEEVSQWLEKV